MLLPIGLTVIRLYFRCSGVCKHYHKLVATKAVGSRTFLFVFYYNFSLSIKMCVCVCCISIACIINWPTVTVYWSFRNQFWLLLLQCTSQAINLKCSSEQIYFDLLMRLCARIKYFVFYFISCISAQTFQIEINRLEMKKQSKFSEENVTWAEIVREVMTSNEM